MNGPIDHEQVIRPVDLGIRVHDRGPIIRSPHDRRADEVITLRVRAACDQGGPRSCRRE